MFFHEGKLSYTINYFILDNLWYKFPQYCKTNRKKVFNGRFYKLILLSILSINNFYPLFLKDNIRYISLIVVLVSLF